MQPIDEKAIRATASIFGPQSAAAKALEDAKKKRSEGFAVQFLKDGNTIIVVTRISPIPTNQPPQGELL